MIGRFPTARHVAEILRDKVHDMSKVVIWDAPNLAPMARIGPMQHDTLPLDVRFFDMTTHDGRIYRVRVSDITPEEPT